MDNKSIITEELLNTINPKTNKTTKQMLQSLNVYTEGEKITFEEAMQRLKPVCEQIVKQSNGIQRWARFNALITGNTHDEILFYKSDGTNRTRYAILDEDKDNYIVADKCNDIECVGSFKIPKDMFDKTGKIVEERVSLK